jgi:hypothetical protein
VVVFIGDGERRQRSRDVVFAKAAGGLVCRRRHRSSPGTRSWVSPPAVERCQRRCRSRRGFGRWHRTDGRRAISSAARGLGSGAHGPGADMSDAHGAEQPLHMRLRGPCLTRMTALNHQLSRRPDSVDLGRSLDCWLWDLRDLHASQLVVKGSAGPITWVHRRQLPVEGRHNSRHRSGAPRRRPTPWPPVGRRRTPRPPIGRGPT